MITIRKNSLPAELKKFPIVLYGAGYAGRQCQKILVQSTVKVEFFVDDDRTKWGKKIEELIVHSYEELAAYCKDRERVNIILTSIYGIQISKRLEKIPNIQIYEMYDWYTEEVMPERFGKKIYSDKALKKFRDGVDEIKTYLCDKESFRIFHNLYQYMITGDINFISEISTEEEQYFIKEVKNYFGEKKISIIDAGAYEGELIRAILDLNLNVNKWYCFETNKDNYKQMQINAKDNNFKGIQICENKGLWNKNIILYVDGNGTSSKVVETGKTDNKIEMTTIDDYFTNTQIDLIKMDIEGAEMNALKGGLKTIKRDRPVLAISIYHSVEDYYEIIKMLIRELKDYKYYVRHHSMVFCETVLYAIPN